MSDPFDYQKLAFANAEYAYVLCVTKKWQSQDLCWFLKDASTRHHYDAAAMREYFCLGRTTSGLHFKCVTMIAHFICEWKNGEYAWL